MAGITKQAADLGKKVATFYVYKIVPASKLFIAKVGPPVRRSSKFVIRKLRPGVQKSTEALIGVIQPKVDRTSQQLVRKLSDLKTDLRGPTTSAEVQLGKKEGNDDYRERYIPITRKSLVRLLVEKKDFFTKEERKRYDDFAVALDAAIVNKYYGILQELKGLFDPINPDKDTIETRKLNPRERQDSEFWLLQMLDDLMEKANFHELPEQVVLNALKEHEVSDGVKVSVDTDKYDVLKFWALGKETIPVSIPWYQSYFNKPEDLPKSKEYYKRVVVAIRFKRDQKLLLKSFKEIPVNALEMMIPDGKIRIGKMDYGIIATSVSLASIGLIAKVVTLLAHMNVDWTLIVTLVTGLTAFRGWTMYSNKKNKYLADLSRLLYFKNIANNRGLLALLVDRAQDESFKEALMVYAFLLANRPRSMLGKESVEMSPQELGGLNTADLEEKIIQWVHQVSGTKIEFEACEAIDLLKQFGILSEVDGKMHVLALEAAIRNLPQSPHSLFARGKESDISEGYDRDVFLETEDQYKKTDKIERRIGWN